MVREESREVGSPMGSRLSKPGMLGALTSRHLHHPLTVTPQLPTQLCRALAATKICQLPAELQQDILKCPLGCSPSTASQHPRLPIQLQPTNCNRSSQLLTQLHFIASTACSDRLLVSADAWRSGTLHRHGIHYITHASTISRSTKMTWLGPAVPEFAIWA